MNGRRNWMEQPRMEPDAIKTLSDKAAPRRVLLVDTGEIIAEPPAHLLLAEFRRLMSLYPGREIAAEHLKDGKWVRFLLGVKE